MKTHNFFLIMLLGLLIKPQANTISGLVTNLNGDALSGAIVKWQVIGDSTDTVYTVKTDVNGQFKFVSVDSNKVQTKRIPVPDEISVVKKGFYNRIISISKCDSMGIIIEMAPQETGTLKDIDGNVYHTIRIGKQIWTIENFRATKFNDGTAIPKAISKAKWKDATTPLFCFYNNTTDIDFIIKYGALYNHKVIETGKLAPEGWHVPTIADWDTLVQYLYNNGYGDEPCGVSKAVAKALAAKTGWLTCKEPGTIGNNLSRNNKSGFSALGGGIRDNLGSYRSINEYGYWWSAPDGIYYYLSNCDCSIDGICGAYIGLSVRLIKDSF